MVALYAHLSIISWQEMDELFSLRQVIIKYRQCGCTLHDFIELKVVYFLQYIDIYNRSVMHVTAIEMAECNHYKQACHSELGVVFRFHFQNNLFVIIIGISWYQHWNCWNHGVILTPWYQQLQCWLRSFNFSSASTENFRWIPRSFVLRRWRGNSLLCEDPSQKSSDTISIKKFRVIA